MTTHKIIQGDCVESLRTLPDASVHCCVTSPPYWGLRDYGHDGQIGLEATPEAYVARMVEVFREVRRVLRDDGTCWVNLGDSYAGGGGFAPDAPCNVARREMIAEGDCKQGAFNLSQRQHTRNKSGGIKPQGTLKAKDLVGIPWRVAFALQADGWWLRQDIIWHKPNPMPESVRDRCTKAHEYVFLLTKSERYFYDAEAVSEAVVCVRGPGNKKPLKGVEEDGEKHRTRAGLHLAAERWRQDGPPLSRNRRSVWTVTTKPYSGAHFAVMPSDLVEPCIKAGTSEEGCCPECGKPWERVVERSETDYARLARESSWKEMDSAALARGVITKAGKGGQTRKPNGTVPSLKAAAVISEQWQPGCSCLVHAADCDLDDDCQCQPKPHKPVPCTVLDPFAGSGTTLAVAAELGRSGIGCELNPEYIALAERRIKDARSSVALFEGMTA